MMFQLGDDGVVSSVNEDDLIYVDKNELEKFIESYQELEKENEQLKKELQKYDGWCNSVKRENIDKVLKMSIFEIVEAFEYYDKKIEDYEKVLNGDVE